MATTVQHIVRWSAQDWRTSRVRMESAVSGDVWLRTVYYEALNAIFERGGEIPASPGILKSILLLPVEHIERCLPIILECGAFGRGGLKEEVREDGTHVLVNARASEDLAEEHAYREAQRERGRLGGRLPAKTNGQAGANHPLTASKAVANQELTGGLPSADRQPNPPTPSPLPSPLPTPTPKEKTQTVTGKPGTDSPAAPPNPVQSFLTPPGPEPMDDVRDEIARWAVKAKGRPKSVPPRLLEAVVVRCLREIRQAKVVPERCATSASQVISLWSALGHPDVNRFAEELVLVARAAQMSSDKMFARDIRAENWPEGVDRTYNVATICRHDRWDDRLQAARRWEEGTQRTRDGVAYAKRARWMEAGAPGSWVGLEEPQALHRSYLRCAKVLFEEELAAVPLDGAAERLGKLGEAPGVSADLTAIVRLALDETGLW